MSIIGWVVLGALAGWVGSIIMGRNDRMGCITNIIVGVIGAFLGGWIFNLFGGAGITGFNIWSFLVAVVGAVVLLAIVGLFTRR